MTGPQETPRGRGSRLRARLTTNRARLDGPDRIAGVDLARGLAVIGMLAAHLLWTAGPWSWTDPSTWSSIVDGRSSILFATLAGVSIGLVSGGTKPISDPLLRVVRARLAVRAAALLVLGILLTLTGVPVYVILQAYAFLFILALPFLRVRASILWGVAGVLAVIMPFIQLVLGALPVWQGLFGELLDVLLGWHYPFTVWIVFVLVGLAIARTGARDVAAQMRLLVLGAVLSTVGYALAELPVPPSEWNAALSSDPHTGGVAEVIGSGGFAIAVIAASLLLCRLGPVRLLTLPLRATGAMPLTAYTAQLLVWAMAAWVSVGDVTDLSGFRDLDPFWPLTIGVILGCTAWAVLIGRGPMEWLLDALARRSIPAPPTDTPASEQTSADR